MSIPLIGISNDDPRVCDGNGDDGVTVGESSGLAVGEYAGELTGDVEGEPNGEDTGEPITVSASSVTSIR